MSEPSLEWQRGLHAALTASSGLAAAMGEDVRVYDRVPLNAAYPYLAIAEAQLLDDGNTCEPDMFELFTDIHVWSRAVGMEEAKTISGIVRSIVLAMTGVDDWDVNSVTAQAARHMSDPDGLTTHSVLTFRALLQPA